MVRCPNCGSDSESVGSEWNYFRYQIKSYVCSKCKKKFQACYLDGKLSHTIPKTLDIRSKVVEYLKKHGQATEEEIAAALSLRTQEVLKILEALEKEGAAYSYSDS